jgi:hypothetical protein
VRHSGFRTLVGDFVGIGGSARPVSQLNYAGGRLSFAVLPQWESGGDLVMEGKMKGTGLLRRNYIAL